MTFDEIPNRMRQLGVDRAWLCEKCDYSPSTLASVLAPRGSNKTEKALRRIWEVLDHEERRQNEAAKSPLPLSQRVSLEPSDDQFNHWMAAAYSKPGRTFDEWAKAGLDALADEELANRIRPLSSKVADHEHDYRTGKGITPIPKEKES